MFALAAVLLVVLAAVSVVNGFGTTSGLGLQMLAAAVAAGIAAWAWRR